MKKSFILASILALSSTTLMAVDAKNNWFTGLEAGKTKHKYSASALGTSISGDESDSSVTLKIGKYLGSLGRIYGGYTAYNTDDNIDISSYSLGYDYLIYNNSNFTPFVGLNVGNVNYEEKGLQASIAGSGLTVNKDTIDISGVYYGVEVGALYEASKNLDIEIGIRLAKTTGNDAVTFSNGVDSASINYNGLKNQDNFSA